MNPTVAIYGFGHYLPPRVIHNAELEQLVDTSDEWIATRTGIRERHVVERPGVPSSDLGREACARALEESGFAAGDVSHLFLATLTPDMVCPSGACVLEEKLGIKGAIAMDINAACSGFVYSLHLARAMVALDESATVLSCAAEVLSSRTNWTDRATCVLFGDGSGAAVIAGAEEQTGKKPLAFLRDVILSSDGELADLLTIRGGGSAFPYTLGQEIGPNFFIEMNGRDVYKHAVRSMESISRQMMEKHGLAASDVDVFLPHQANYRIIEAVGKKLGFTSEQVFVNVGKVGNTSAAAVPIALDQAWKQGRIKPGGRMLITSFGAGFTWGSALLEFLP